MSFVAIDSRGVRRRDKRTLFMVLALFVAVFSFVFLTQSFKGPGDVEAANIANFDPGYIISDYQMGNYNSMSEAEIQNFLKQKGNCNDTRIYLAGYYTNYSYHIKDGHFVCLADETFGEGTAYGESASNGSSAAHIIWQAAQDYKINPQVLIVLLQKEQGLITDSWPNDRQYRSATGYGCPDTAPCSSQYYGFKNQVRKAAALFRTVLDGGWTNYPLGNNYIQYNPDADCGGSVVNIRSLATSALYRYTPYQPNAGALAAGYGTAYCGAYGNRNFYLYFEDWFGGITDKNVKYVTLDTPRYMEVKETTNRIDPRDGNTVDKIAGGTILKFMTKTILKNGKACLRTEYGTINNENVCLMFDDLKEVSFTFEEIETAKVKKIVSGAKKIQLRTGNEVASYEDEMTRELVVKTVFQGMTYYITRYDYENSNSEYGFRADYVEELPSYEKLESPRAITLKNITNRVNPLTGEFYSTLSLNVIYKVASSIKIGNTVYYRTEHNTLNDIQAAISEKDIVFVDFIDFETPRYMRIKARVNRINPITNEKIDSLEAGRIIKFVTKIFINGEWYYRTEHNTINNLCMAIPASSVEEIGN